MEQFNKKEKMTNHRILLGGYKKSLRIFFTLGIATTMAFGLTGCGNSEAPVEEAEVTEEVETEEVETEENNTQKVVGEDSTDTLTIDELIAGIGAADIDEVWNNQEALDFIANWMEQNGYYDIKAEFVGDVPVCEAHFILRSNESDKHIYAEVTPSYGGMFIYFARNENEEDLAAQRSPDLPSSLKLNEIIEQK